MSVRPRGDSVAWALGALVWIASSSALADDPGARLFARHLTDGRLARQPLLDHATAHTGVLAARARTGATGRGVTICVVDSGLDLSHRDFRDPSGRTRVRWLLDLASVPRGVHPDRELEGGAAWSGDDIDAAFAAGEPIPRDRHGHGTAVASAAAGDDGDGAGPGPFAGAAPEASLVIVNALRDRSVGFADGDVAIGARFCAAHGERGRTVLVLGLGGHDGAHDGTEPLEVELDRLARDGLTIVVAAGNDGARDVHAAGLLRAGERASIPLELPAIERSEEDRHLFVTVEGAARLAAVAPDGTRLEASAAGERTTTLHRGGRLSIAASRPGVWAVLASGGAGDPALAGGRYTLEIAGPARFDLFLARASLGRTFTSPRFSGPFASRSETVAIPATATGVIAVGASLPRASVATDRGAIELSANDDGSAAFTASGPTSRGAPKPELSAPGLMVVARSGDLDPADPASLFSGSRADFDASVVGPRLALAGTSLAAPLVAGTIALAMEARPLEPALVKALLASTARGERWSPRTGYGELDADAFLEAAALDDLAVPAASDSLSVTRAFATPGTTLIATAILRDRSGRPARGEVRFEIGGDSVETLAIGIAQAELDVPPSIVGGRVVVRASAGSTPLGEASALIASDEARAREGVTVRGGCDAAGSTPLSVFVAIGAIAARSRKKRG